jgi:hypothetical protein
MTLESHIETLVAEHVATLLSQAENHEKQAKVLRAEAEQKAAIRRQELTNEASGGKSLWRVHLKGGWTNGYSGHEAAVAYTVIAANEAEALAMPASAGTGLSQKNYWPNVIDSRWAIPV